MVEQNRTDNWQRDPTIPQVVEGGTGGDGGSAGGGNNEMLVADMAVAEILADILTELKILNLRQEEVFEESIHNDGDIT